MTPIEMKKERDQALDWVKGALVVLMVVYHSLNYSAFLPLAFAHLAFLPPSFVFLAGFLITNSYLARYNVTDWRLHQRLFLRGAKLILLFTALNLILYLINIGPAAVQLFAENLQAIYFAPAKRVASFPILASIGYVLLLGPLLLRIGTWSRWSLVTLAFALLMFCSVMEWRSSVSYHVGMISFGIIGAAFGFVPLGRIARLASKWPIVVALYCLYRTVGNFIGEPYPMQFTGVLTGLLLLYCAALMLRTNTHVFKQVVLLGRYSLLGYIIQLGILRVIVGSFGRFDTPLTVLTLAVATLTGTWAVTFIIDWLRTRARIVDLTYKAAFA